MPLSPNMCAYMGAAIFVVCSTVCKQSFRYPPVAVRLTQTVSEHNLINHAWHHDDWGKVACSRATQLHTECTICWFQRLDSSGSVTESVQAVTFVIMIWINTAPLPASQAQGKGLALASGMGLPALGGPARPRPHAMAWGISIHHGMIMMRALHRHDGVGLPLLVVGSRIARLQLQVQLT